MAANKKTLLTFSILTFGLIIICLGLSLWQIQRYSWKTDILRKIENSSDIRSLSVQKCFLDSKERKAQDYTQVKIQGSFLHDLEIFITPRKYKEELGAHLITPFLLDCGQIVFVNRGWSPYPLTSKTLMNRPQGRQTLTGIVRFPKKARWFTPHNNPQDNQWHTMDIPQMANAIELRDKKGQISSKNFLPFYIISSPINKSSQKSSPRIYPIELSFQEFLVNNHLMYALTWLALAFAIGLAYIFYLKHYGWVPSPSRTANKNTSM